MTTFERLLPTLCLAMLAACVATPLPQPPSFELDLEEVEAEVADTTVTFRGSAGALTPGSVTLRISPGETDSDPLLEQGEGEVAQDGSFTIAVVSPSENVFFFEAITEEEDVFVGAASIDGSGVVVDADPGPDADDDGSPDEIDCAPDDPSLSGQRCP